MASYKVAVLDDYSGFAKAPFEKLGPQYETTHLDKTLLAYNHPDTPRSVKDELVKRLEPYDIISTMRERTPFPGELVKRLPNLKLLLTTGNRNAALDLPALKERDIPVVGTTNERVGPAPGPDSTTQHCVAMILALVRNIAQDDASVKQGGWQTGVATGLSGKTFGTVGLGRLGVSVATIMHMAFGMKIIAWSSNLTQEKADEAAQAKGLAPEVNGEKIFKVVSREELFSQADVVSVQLVLSDRSRGLITKDDLSKMNPSSFFVNSSRGPLVVEKDLLSILESGKIRGAGLDVFEIEPLPADSPWRSTAWGKDGRSHVLLTPHMGYVEESILQVWYGQHVASIKSWANGETLTKLIT